MNDLTITIPAEYIRNLINQELDARKEAEESELKKAREGRKHMRIGKYSCYPKLRRSFESFEELGGVINKSVAAVQQRMNGKLPFTTREKELILKYLGVEVNAANKRLYFDIGRKEKAA